MAGKRCTPQFDISDIMTHKIAFRKGFDRDVQNVTEYSQAIHIRPARMQKGGAAMFIRIEKARRTLCVWNGCQKVFSCRVGLGRAPEGPKRREGDGRTPEGVYRVCLVKEAGKYGRSLGLSYPGAQDAQLAHARGDIDSATLANILAAHAQNKRPPWGSPLGGEIYLHEGGSQADWTQGCIALDEADMDILFPLRDRIERVEIVP